MTPSRFLRRAARHAVRCSALFVACVACVACAAALVAQPSQPVQPDVFVAPVTITNGRLQIGPPRNLTDRPGYDNQPSFSADSRGVYYTSTRADAQADIYFVDVASGRERRVTVTAPESEYSATEVPGGEAISVIRVERDSTQRLWRLPLDAGADSVIFAALRPVGYHAWANARQLVMFVLGAPNALVLGDRMTGSLDTVATNVGRSMHRIPGTEQVSFVRRLDDSTSAVMALDVRSRAVRELTQLPSGVEDYAWLPDGRIIAGRGSVLMLCDLERPTHWAIVAELGAAGLSTITRLAVSPDGAKIALVALPIAPNR